MRTKVYTHIYIHRQNRVGWDGMGMEGKERNESVSVSMMALGNDRDTHTAHTDKDKKTQRKAHTERGSFFFSLLFAVSTLCLAITHSFTFLSEKRTDPPILIPHPHLSFLPSFLPSSIHSYPIFVSAYVCVCVCARVWLSHSIHFRLFSSSSLSTLTTVFTVTVHFLSFPESYLSHQKAQITRPISHLSPSFFSLPSFLPFFH